MICVLALDIAMHRTGWAIGTPVAGTHPAKGVFETENWPDHEGKNLHAFKTFLNAMRELYPITHLVLEEVFVDVRGFGAKNFQFNGTQAQLMLSATALEWAYANGIEDFQANIDNWRMRFLGLNRKPKESKKDDAYWKNLALRVAAQEHNWFCEFHDEAEALGIMHYALGELDKDYKRRTNRLHNKQQVDQMLGRGLHER
jgi:hypothetical protein